MQSYCNGEKDDGMRRFIIEQMPLHFFYPPRYFGHIPLLAVPCRTLQLAIPQYSQGRNDETSLGYDAFPSALNELRFAL